ncbi:hypothetical protein GCM10022221_67620 [Actinocorallia aurea]
MTPDIPEPALEGRVVPRPGEPGDTPVLIAPTVPVRGPAPIRGRTPADLSAPLAQLLLRHGASAGMLEATAAWLGSERRTSPSTQRDYMIDVAWWVTYLAGRGTTAAAARPVHADQYAAAMREATLSPSTRARRLAAASSWYTYLVRADQAAVNPFAGMDRPAVPQTSTTRSLSKEQLGTLLAYARAHESARTHALLVTIVVTGCRVGGIIGADLKGYGHDAGHEVLDLPVKGPAGAMRRMVLPPVGVEALDRYLETERGYGRGPLFPTRTGNRLDEPAIWRLLRRVAKAAQIPIADHIKPHSLRHTIVTVLRDDGVNKGDVQEFMGHSDARTTDRYDGHLGDLDRTLAYKLNTLLTDLQNGTT